MKHFIHTMTALFIAKITHNLTPYHVIQNGVKELYWELQYVESRQGFLVLTIEDSTSQAPLEWRDKGNSNGYRIKSGM